MIRTRSVSNCLLCGAQGELLYSGMKDRLFSAPGDWQIKRCSQSACGVLWLDPMPIEGDIVKSYQGYYTHQNSEEYHSGSMVRRMYEHLKELYLAHRYGYGEVNSFIEAVLARLMYLYPPGRADLDLKVFFLSARSGARLLEVGCGSGEMLKWLADRGWQVEGLDFDPQAVQNAQAKGLRVHLGSVEQQGFPANSFDAIVMNHVIEHVPNPAALLHECYRILKPGGTLVSVTPNVQSLGHGLFRSSWFHLDPPRHLVLFSPAALRNLSASVFSGSAEIFTTIRRANGPMTASICIRRTGRFLMGGQAPLLFRVWGRCLQFWEWGIKFLRPMVGEEIVLIARKRIDPT